LEIRLRTQQSSLLDTVQYELDVSVSMDMHAEPTPSIGQSSCFTGQHIWHAKELEAKT